jgi:protein-arginine kinase activator protein McsA
MKTGEEEEATPAVRMEKKKKDATIKVIDVVEEDLDHTGATAAPSGKESTEERVQCGECGRKFAASRIQRHTAACLKRKESAARPKFDSRAQRMNVRLAPLAPLKSKSLTGGGPQIRPVVLLGAPADE